MTTSTQIKERRERLGVSQAWVAEKVRELSGNEKFSQQAYQKFEAKPNGKSAYIMHILQALDLAERERMSESAVSEVAASYGRSSGTSFALSEMVKRVAALVNSGKLNNEDIALIRQMIERMARE